MKALVIENLSKRFRSTKELAVDHVNFSVEKGEIMALLGESGSGKTTLLRLISGLEKADSGIIQIHENRVLDEKMNVKPENRNVGFIFQNHVLFPHLNVFQNVSFGLHNRKESWIQERVKESLELVNLKGLEMRFPHQLSGGQQQRVAIARALAPAPKIMLLDEPFSNLDNNLKDQVREEIKSIIRKAGVTAVFVTHDTKDALIAGDKIALMHQGKIIQINDPRSIYDHPVNELVARFFGKVNILHLEIDQKVVKTELGTHDNLPTNLFAPNTKIMVRPEHILINADPKTGIEGRIVNILFMGDHILLKVSVKIMDNNQHVLFIKCNPDGLFDIGQTIFFKIDFSMVKKIG